MYNSRLVTTFINNVTKDGKKTTAERIFYGALSVIEERTGDDPLKVFKKAVENARPLVEVKSRRVGGSTYQVPMEVRSDRQQSLAIRWLLLAVREKKGRPTHQQLADELLAAYNREGAAMTRRENTHRMADANKAFAHFAW